MATALIDGDIVAYRCAAASEDTDLDIAILRADKVMRDIIYLTEADSYITWLTGKNNFRKLIYPEYKANRKDKPKPKWLQDIREFMYKEWNAIITEGCEADDQLGIHQDETTCICSIDKDLLQISGRHFNWVKSEFLYQTENQALKSFYLQLLQGDRGDNIPGIAGIGPKKAEKILDGIDQERDLFNACLEAYQNDLDTMIRNGKLLWIWRTEGGIWDPTELIGENRFKHEEVAKSVFTEQNAEETSQSTELTDPEIHGM